MPKSNPKLPKTFPSTFPLDTPETVALSKTYKPHSISKIKHTALKPGDFITLRRNPSVIGYILSITTHGINPTYTIKKSVHYETRARIQFLHPHADFFPDRPTKHLFFLPLSPREKLALLLAHSEAEKQARASNPLNGRPSSSINLARARQVASARRAAALLSLSESPLPA